MVYSNMVYCPNVVVGWRSGVRRRKHSLRHRNPDLQTTTTLSQYIILQPTTVLRSSRWAKDCPKHVELIQKSIEMLLLHLVGHLYYSPTHIYFRSGLYITKFPA